MSNNMKSDVNEDTFLRKLAPSHEQKLSSILDTQDSWEVVVARIPTNPDLLFNPHEEWKPRYNTSHIFTFKSMGGSPTRNLLTNWGTKNIRLKHLIQVLRLTKLHYAADFIERDVLHKTLACQGAFSGVVGAFGEKNLDNFSTDESSKNKGLHELHYQNGELHQESSRIHGATVQQDFNNQINHATPVESLDSFRMEDPRHMMPQNFLEGIQRDSKVDCELESRCDAIVASTVQADRSWASVGRENNRNGNSYCSASEQSKANSNTSDLLSHGEILQDFIKDLKEIRYVTLQKITNNFDVREALEGGRLIGEGGFGHVFLGVFDNQVRVAVKCLKDNTEDTLTQFIAEIKTLSSLRHKNLVHLMAYSHDGCRRCLVYEYMMNGSLEDRLACKNNTLPLSAAIRMDIIKGTARGIEFLHQNHLIHRDIKSANILLDKDWTPKVGDFATARITASGMTTKKLLTSKIIGTHVYFAPEAYAGHIHIGLDTFSFGVVLLEVLTGLPVLDPNRKEHDLKSFVQDHCEEPDDDDDDDDEDEEEGGIRKKEPGTIFDLLDRKAGPWNREIVELLFAISNKCLETLTRKRAKMKQIMKWLDAGKICN